MAYKNIKVPADGDKITLGANHTLKVSDNPIIPFIEGDGTGGDIWRASQYVFDTAVKKAYRASARSRGRKFRGREIINQFNTWLPDDTVEAFREFRVAIKGPLTTPIGGASIAQRGAAPDLDLY